MFRLVDSEGNYISEAFHDICDKSTYVGFTDNEKQAKILCEEYADYVINQLDDIVHLEKVKV